MEIKHSKKGIATSLDAAEAIIAEMYKTLEDIKRVYNGSYDLPHKHEAISYYCCMIATMSNVVVNVLGFDIRSTKNDMRITAEIFNRAHYYRQSIEIEMNKEEK